MHLRAAPHEPWVGREGLYHRLVIVGLVEQHFCVTLQPTRPMWGDVSRVKVVIGVEGYRGGQKSLLESLHESRIVESRATKAVERKKNRPHAHP